MNSILKIDISAILDNLRYKENAKYCIMNEDTLNAINNELKYKIDFKTDTSARIYNLRIATNNELKFGEFEIR